MSMSLLEKGISGPHCLQNQPGSLFADKPTILIKQGDPGFAAAYQQWLLGKPPTDSPAWKQGVYATYPLSPEAKLLCPCALCQEVPAF